MQVIFTQSNETALVEMYGTSITAGSTSLLYLKSCLIDYGSCSQFLLAAG